MKQPSRSANIFIYMDYIRRMDDCLYMYSSNQDGSYKISGYEDST